MEAIAVFLRKLLGYQRDRSLLLQILLDNETVTNTCPIIL